MEKWKSLVLRDGSPPPPAAEASASALAAELPKNSKGYRGPGRTDFGMRIDSPRGWRVSFMSL